MAWIESVGKRGLTHKTWADDSGPTKHHREQVLKTVMHYPSVVDGPLNTEVDFSPVRVDVPAFDGWRITQSGWHYALGKDLANHGDEDGWLGFGGRGGQHWLKFRLLRVGYLHWPTRAWEDVGGAPTYDRANLSQETDGLTIGPAGAEASITVGSSATWENIWQTPGGGQLNALWRVEGRRLKEDVYINQVAREWIADNHPPSTTPSETYFGFVFKIDASDIPKWVKNGIVQDINGDFDDDDGAIEYQDALDRLLGFMPTSYAHSDLYGDERDTIRLRKRIWLDGDGNHYLLVGAKVPDLNGMHEGGITFDPTNNYQPGAEGQDTYMFDGNPDKHFGGEADITYDASRNILLLFDISDISSSDTCDSATMSLWPKQGYSGNRSIQLHELLAANASWVEGSTADPGYGKAVWDHHTEESSGGAADEVDWAGSPGCETEGTDYSAAELGEFTVGNNDISEQQAVLVAADVEDWFGGIANYGTIQRGSAFGWRSSDYATAGERPKLSVTYTEVSADKDVQPTAESVTVGDTATVDPLVIPDLSESEAVTVGDTPTLLLRDFISEQDDITVGDTATVDPVSPTEISGTEPVTVGDTATLEPLLIDISETEDITVGDTATVDAILLEVSESESVTTGDVATLSPVTPTDVSESDAVTVVDTPTVQIPSEDVWNISESDGVTVVDTATLGPVTPTDIDVSDDVTVGDTPTVQRTVEDEWYVSEAEAVTVGEIVTIYLTIDISETEAVTVGDTATLTLNLADIDESEAVTVVDTPTLGPVTPIDVSEVDAVTVVDTATVAFFQPILTLSVGDAVSVTDLASVGYYIVLLGLDKPEKKPYEYQKDMLDMEPIVRPVSPTFAMRQEQKSVMEANRVAVQLERQNEAEAARRVSAMLAREKADKDKADRRRAASLTNIAKAQIAKEAKAQKQAEINKVRKKSLQKARRKLKRQRKKK